MCLALAAPLVLVAQGTLRAPRPGLADIPLPSLENLEQSVASQIESLQKAAAEAIQKPTAADAELAQAYGNLGVLHHGYELGDAAKPSYANAAQLAPRDFRWPYLLGHLAGGRGDLAGAASSYELAASLNEKYVPVWVNLGKTYRDLDRLDDASKALQNALAVNPDSPAALAASGEVELRQRHFKQAVTHLEAALDKIPSANRLHYSLAMAYRGMNDLERARSHFKQSGKVGVRPVDPVFDVVREVRVGARIYTLEGKTAFNAGRYDDAARLFVRAVGADESSAAALINLGTALEKLGDTQAAIERFQTALKIDPTEATALFNLGVLSAKTGNNSATAEHLTAYLKGHPDDIEARRELAKALSRLGRLPAVESQYRMLLAANPGDEDSLTALANNLAQQGRFNEIVNLLQSNLDQFPGRVRTTYALARVLVAAPDKTVRDGARALTLAQAAFKRQGTVAHGQTLAQAFAQVGRCDEAAELQSKLVSVAKRAAETDMATGLENDLTRYQSGPPCAVD